MQRSIRQAVATACLLLVSSVGVFAADAKPEGKDVEPLMVTRGKQVFADDFAGPSLDSKWKVAKGTWVVKDGALKGTELASDMHPAVLRTDLKTTDAVFQFDFRFEPGAKQTHLSLNGAKGHICRVTITPGGFQVRKDGSKTDEADKGALLDSCKQTFEPGKWYTMTVEVLGKEIVARTDDQHFAMGEDAKVASEKTNFGFPVGGDSVCLDNVKVWEAAPNPTWAKTKEKLAGEHPEKMTTPARPAAAKKK